MANEHPQLKIDDLNMSIADCLVTLFPALKGHIYNNLLYEGAEVPCFFITYTQGQQIKKECSGTSLRTIYVDLIYQSSFTANDLFYDYRKKAETLDEELEKTLTYNVYEKDSDGNYVVDSEGNLNLLKSIPLDSHDRTWEYDQSAMHYKFNLKLRLIDEDATFEEGDTMNDLDYSLEEKEDG